MRPRPTSEGREILRGEWFLGLSVALGVLVLLRLLARRPLFAARARPLSVPDVMVLGVSLALLIFHCLAMFAPDAVALVGALDPPAAAIRDLSNPAGQAAYWLPAVGTVYSIRRLWWPAPVATLPTLVAVGWTMYGSFTLTQHLVAIVAAGLAVGLVVTGLIAGVGRARATAVGEPVT